jgi:hypothetical protein
MIRWAEVILNRAEAYAHKNDTKALDDVNIIRKRAGLAGEPEMTTANMAARGYASLLDVVLDERRLELAFEGFRFFDLARHDRIIEVHNSVNAKDSYWQVRKPLTETRIFLPIPTSALEQNSALTQNPGY